MEKITIVTKHDISSAYSCIQYLAKEMKRDYEVKVWSCTPPEKFELLKNPEINYTFLKSWYRNIRKVRYGLMLLHAFLVLVREKSDFIINDIDFFMAGYFIKKLFPNRKFIMYFTEINGKDVQTFKIIEQFYKIHSNMPDMTIECLKERAEYRAQEFKINKNVFYINNTIGTDELDEANRENVCKEDYIPETFANKPIVFYAGGCDLSRDLGMFIREIAKVKEVCFLAFCYGEIGAIDCVRQTCAELFDAGQFAVHQAVPRKILLNVMSFADIGIVYYDPEYSINFKYASPSKFFEYIAKGLNVVSSNNEGINHIIVDNGIGVCVQKGENLSDAIQRLLATGLKERTEIVKIFNDKYSYDISAKNTLNHIRGLLNN